MKGRYEPEGILAATQRIVMMLGQEDEISEWRWRQIDKEVRAIRGERFMPESSSTVEHPE